MHVCFFSVHRNTTVNFAVGYYRVDRIEIAVVVVFQFVGGGFLSTLVNHFPLLSQGLEGVLRDPGFGRNRARDSGIQRKSSRDS